MLEKYNNSVKWELSTEKQAGGPGCRSPLLGRLRRGEIILSGNVLINLRNRDNWF